MAVVQAHGHVQLFGWGGLMVLGVGLHFLPRLRGTPMAGARFAPAALVGLAGGLLLRTVAQPIAAAGIFPSIAQPALVLSGVLELFAVVAVVGMLIATLRTGPSLGTRAGLRPVLPFFAIAFSSLPLALAVNAYGLWLGSGLVPGWHDRVSVLLGLEGFLVPVAVAMSMRLFPLYFRTRLPRIGAMHAGLGVWIVGLLLRLADFDLGPIIQAVGAGLFLIGLGVFAPRVPRPRDAIHLLVDPMQWHALTAYGWLAAAALVLGTGASDDAERHLLGAGFVTLLIFGVGAHMLPGFARRSLRSRGLVWATLVLGNGATALRVIPSLWPTPLSSAAAGSVYALAGLLGLVAVTVFAVNVVVGSRISGKP